MSSAEGATVLRIEYVNECTSIKEENYLKGRLYYLQHGKHVIRADVRRDIRKTLSLFFRHLLGGRILVWEVSS